MKIINLCLIYFNCFIHLSTYIHQLNWKERYDEEWYCFLLNSAVVDSINSNGEIENSHTQASALTSQESR